MRGEVQPGNFKHVSTTKAFQFPYCVGKFNLRHSASTPEWRNFNSRTAWGSSRLFFVQFLLQSKFQFPYCVGKFNKVRRFFVTLHMISIPVLRGEVQRMVCRGVVFRTDFNSRTAWGSSTYWDCSSRQCHRNFNSRTAWGSSTRLPRKVTKTLTLFQFPYCVGKFNSIHM